jgi:hypothetical protein
MIRRSLATAFAGLALAFGGAAVAGPRGGEIEVESFSWGSTAAGELSPPVTSLQDPGVGDPSIARRSTITLHSFDLDRPSANPHPATKYEDMTVNVGAGMGRAPAAPDWTKTQEIRASKDLAPTPGSALLPVPQKVREAAARMSSEHRSTREVLISGVVQNGNHAPRAPLAPMTSVPQRPPVPDGTSSTLMLGERTLRPVPGAPGSRR